MPNWIRELHRAIAIGSGVFLEIAGLGYLPFALIIAMIRLKYSGAVSENMPSPSEISAS